jgi:site-specific DNA recombinase
LDRAVAYTRVSTEEQADGLSLGVQRERIEAWCRAAGVDLVEVIEDRGISGGRRLSERPGGARIAGLLAQRNPEAEAVVIVRLDRLGRDAAETLQLLKRFTDGKVGLVSITERLDLTTPQGRAMAGVAAVFAELERALIGQRTAEALDQLRNEGRRYGPVPFGFKVEARHLVPDTEEQAVLRSIRRMRGRGLSYAAIAERLNSKGVPSKRGGRWFSMSVRSVLATSVRLQGKPARAKPALQPS